MCPSAFCNFLHQYVGLEEQQQQQWQDFIAAEHKQLKGSAEDECLFAGLAQRAVVPLGPWSHLQRAEEQKRITADLDKDLAPWISYSILPQWAPHSEMPFLKGTPCLVWSLWWGEGSLTFSNTIWCPQRLQLMTNIIQTWASGCSQSADRDEGWMLQLPIPTQAAEWILHGHWPPRSGGSSSSFLLAHPARAVRSPSPATLAPGEITHRLVRLICFISELFFTLYNI